MPVPARRRRFGNPLPGLAASIADCRVALLNPVPGGNIRNDQPAGGTHDDDFHSAASAEIRAAPKAKTRNLSLDRARTFLTLVVLIHHAVIPYTHFGHTDPEVLASAST